MHLRTFNSLEYQNKIDVDKVDTLLFSGAGAAGLCYAGVAEALEKVGLYGKVDNFVGSSAGAIIALSFALGYSVDDIKRIVKETDFAKFMDAPLIDLNKIIKDVELLRKHPEQAALIAIYLFGTFALCPGDFARQFLKELIEGAGYKADITFKQFEKHSKTKLTVTVCDIGIQREIYCNAKTTPDAKLLDCVYSSMAIPFVFRPNDPFNRGSNCAVDGGTVSNYAVEAAGDNWLGFIVETKESILTPHYQPVNSIFDYITGLIGTLRANMYNQTFSKQENIDRTIFITPVIGCLEFDADEKKRNAQIKAGYDATEAYFA